MSDYQRQLEEEKRSKETKARIKKQYGYGEGWKKYSEVECSGGCGDFLTHEEEGWGICLSCRMGEGD
tara:strand:- start:304 stop:504 length:201 start_codon:yes stop_codon:yes gene_type:complete